jgi:hypothetical protein
MKIHEDPGMISTNISRLMQNELINKNGSDLNPLFYIVIFLLAIIF